MAAVSATPPPRSDDREGVSLTRLLWVAPLTVAVAVALNYLIKTVAQALDPSLARIVLVAVIFGVWKTAAGVVPLGDSRRICQVPEVGRSIRLTVWTSSSPALSGFSTEESR